MNAYDRGWEDFLNGIPRWECPFEMAIDSSAWHQGWAEAHTEKLEHNAFYWGTRPYGER